MDHNILLLKYVSNPMHFITNVYKLDRSKATCSFTWQPMQYCALYHVLCTVVPHTCTSQTNAVEQFQMVGQLVGKCGLIKAPKQKVTFK